MDVYYSVVFSIFGLVFGSFFGVIIDRLPTGRNIATGRSECDLCHRQLQAIDLIPIFSFFSQRGRCRYCHTKLSLRYPFLEILTAGIFLISYTQFGLSIDCFVACVLGSILIIVSFIDYDTMIINDRFHVMILLLGAIRIFTHQLTITDALLGAVIVSVPLLVIALVTQGMGGGDVKLMAASGFLLGPWNILVAFVIGVILGGIFGVIALLRKAKSLKSEMPFGPYLCIGIFVALLYGPQIIALYLSFFN